MVADKALVMVKVLNAKLAKQIVILHYDWKEGSEYRKIWSELMAVNTDYGCHATVLGWASRDTVMGPTARLCNQTFWLVRIKGQFFWWAAPDDDSNLAKLHLPMMEQLFVG